MTSGETCEIREYARAEEVTEEIEDCIRDGETSLISEHVSKLEQTFVRLTSLVTGWPRGESSE